MLSVANLNTHTHIWLYFSLGGVVRKQLATYYYYSIHSPINTILIFATQKKITVKNMKKIKFHR